jgi:hypothetical protein
MPTASMRAIFGLVVLAALPQFFPEPLVTVHLASPVRVEGRSVTPLERQGDTIRESLTEELRRKRKTLTLVERADQADVVLELSEIAVEDGFLFATLTIKTGRESEALTQVRTDAPTIGRLFGEQVDEWVELNRERFRGRRRV